MLADPQVIDVPEGPFRRPDGTLRYLRTISVPLFDENGAPEYLLGIGVDITERRPQEQELRTKQAELAAANDSSPLGLFHTDANGQCTYVNRAYEEMSGLSGEQALRCRLGALGTPARPAQGVPGMAEVRTRVPALSGHLSFRAPGRRDRLGIGKDGSDPGGWQGTGLRRAASTTSPRAVPPKKPCRKANSICARLPIPCRRWSPMSTARSASASTTWHTNGSSASRAKRFAAKPSANCWAKRCTSVPRRISNVPCTAKPCASRSTNCATASTAAPRRPTRRNSTPKAARWSASMSWDTTSPPRRSTSGGWLK